MVYPPTFHWFERTDLAQGANFRPKSVGRREIGVIEGVFAPIIAADITLSAQAAGITGEAVDIWVLFANWFARHWSLPLVAKGNSEFRQVPVQIQFQRLSVTLWSSRFCYREAD